MNLKRGIGILCLSSLFSFPILAQTIGVNGINYVVDSKVVNGTTVVGVRELSNLLGLNLDYNSNTNKIIITEDTHTIEIDLLNSKAKVDNKSPESVVCMKEKGITYLPLRFICENLGIEVGFKDGIATIKSDKISVVASPNKYINPTPYDTSEPRVNVPKEKEYIHKMDPTDPSNPYNHKALVDGRALEIMKSVSVKDIQRPSFIKESSWEHRIAIDWRIIFTTGRLSDIPEYFNRIDGNTKFEHAVKWNTTAKIYTHSSGKLYAKPNISTLFTTVYFNDGTVSFIDQDTNDPEGIDISTSVDSDFNKYPGKTEADIAYIEFSQRNYSLIMKVIHE